jgi:cyclopropane-fatty-acyl-phospholipid synthase
VIRAAASGARVGQLGFNPTFQRMWNLYLAYSEPGFRAGHLDVHQLVLERRWVIAAQPGRLAHRPGLT